MRAMRYGIWMLAVLCVPEALGKQPLTIRHAMETARFMVADDRGTAIAVSPNGRRYVAMLVRGDIDRDGVEAEIIAGELDSLDGARPQSIARLFTRGLGAGPLGPNQRSDAPALVMNTSNFPVWIDDERVALLWEDEGGVHQAIAVNVTTKQVEQLTHSATDVTSFSARNQSLIYVAKQPWSSSKSDQLFHDGFVVTNTDAISLMMGVVDGSPLEALSFGSGQHFVRRSAEEAAAPVSGVGSSVTRYWLPAPAVRPSISPDGRWAIVSSTPEEAPLAWDQYREQVIAEVVQGWRDNKLIAPGSQLLQSFLISMDGVTARPLLDAPMVFYGQPVFPRWSPGGGSVLLGPTYLPIDTADPAGLDGVGWAEVEIATGRYAALPLSLATARAVREVHWVDDGTIRVKLVDRLITYEKLGGVWRQMQSARFEEPELQPRFRIELRQDPNTPPTLYAIDSQSESAHLVFDPNPILHTELALGEVKPVKWSDAQGLQWQGELYLPVGYVEGRRYPLVVQTRGDGMGFFSLYGSGGQRPPLGPGWSVYLAQPLASQGIAVLQVGRAPAGSITSIQSEAWALTRGYDAAVEHLNAVGLIDPNRVGLMGFSRGGWHASYALAFGDRQYAAAITDDNISSGYIEAAALGWVDTERRNGAEPFGSGMKDWLQRSPAFNAEHIRSPLLMVQSGTFVGSRASLVVQSWELFSRLRHLKKPVEFYVAPNVERGYHTLQNPRQLLAVQERALDWWRFWLKDEVDRRPEKIQQYTEWSRLRALRDEDLKSLQSPRLRWSAEPGNVCDIRQC